MSQYRVEYKAYEYPEIAWDITIQEFFEAMELAAQNGLTNMDPKSKIIKKIYERQGVKD